MIIFVRMKILFLFSFKQSTIWYFSLAHKFEIKTWTCNCKGQTWWKRIGNIDIELVVSYFCQDHHLFFAFCLNQNHILDWTPLSFSMEIHNPLLFCWIPNWFLVHKPNDFFSLTIFTNIIKFFQALFLFGICPLEIRISNRRWKNISFQFPWCESTS